MKTKRQYTKRPKLQVDTKPEFQFLKLKKTPDGYEYAERKGKDSVAFILVDQYTHAFGLRLEYKPPVNQHILGAFGGSMEPNKSPLDIVKQEVLEEAGFKVRDSQIRFVGKFFVSTQMNQYCYLYVVAVDSNTPHCIPENPDKWEGLSDLVWVQNSGQIQSECWKAQLAVASYRRK